MPEPLLTFDLYDQFIKSVTTFPEDEKLVNYIGANLLVLLPRENRIVLNYLLSFLDKVSLHAEKNKMPAANLATVFGPNILRTKNDTTQSAQLESPFVNKITQVLIQFHDTLFVPKTNVNITAPTVVTSTSTPPTPTSSLPLKRPSISLLAPPTRNGLVNSSSNSNIVPTPVTPNSPSTEKKKSIMEPSK